MSIEDWSELCAGTLNYDYYEWFDFFCSAEGDYSLLSWVEWAASGTMF